MAVLRDATKDDVGSIVALSSGLFAEDAGTRDPYVDVRWPEVEGAGYFSEVVSGEDCMCVVAEVDGRIVGYLVGRFSYGSSLRPVAVVDLESMYVTAEFRGTGVGSALVREFFVRAKGRGIKLASVTAYRENERAVAFYERHGFVQKKVELETVLD